MSYLNDDERSEVSKWFDIYRLFFDHEANDFECPYDSEEYPSDELELGNQFF